VPGARTVAEAVRLARPLILEGDITMNVNSGNRKKSRIIVWIAGIVLLPVVVFILYTWLTLNWSFSRGERTGYIQKLSKSGWVCKTWEGEMAMVTMPGAIPEKFLFSVWDDSVAKRINAFAGKRVALVYEQHKGIPTSCFGDTEYFIVDIKAIE
jgi:hypothetical protein